MTRRNSNSSACVPADSFWNLNQQIAESVWGRGDGGTISTRVSEPIADVLGIPVSDAKTLFHGSLSAQLGVMAGKASGNGFVGLAAGLLAFLYLEQDRCR